MTVFVPLAGIVDRSPRNAANRSALPGGAGPASRAALERSAGAEGQGRRLDGAAERACQHDADRNPERADRLADGAGVLAATVGQVALACAVLDAHHARVFLAVVGVGVAKVQGEPTGAQGAEQIRARQPTRDGGLRVRGWNRQQRRGHERDEPYPRASPPAQPKRPGYTRPA